MMNRVKWMFIRFSDTLGLPGLLALVSVVAILFYVATVRWPAQQHLELVTVASMRQGGATAVPVEMAASAFLKQLPRAESLPQQLQTVFDTAEGYGLVLDEVAYRKVRKQDERLERYHVDFAIDAPYPNIRIFLAEILAAIPSAALVQLALARDEVQSGDVKARVRLTLFLVQ
jgi:Tfp pilus assembly protein PilO